MKFVGFNYNKISAERVLDSLEGLKIESSLNIDSIRENPSKNPDKSISFLDVYFTSKINYSKNIAKIELKGKVIISIDSKTGEEVKKKWEKKELVEEVKYPLFNFILTKASIKSLELEENLNLPPHFRLPQVSPEKN